MDHLKKSYPNTANPLLIIHQRSHIGGGQTYVNALVETAQKQGHDPLLIENPTPAELIHLLRSGDPQPVIWNVYHEFPFWPYVFSWLKGNRNILVLYGLWHLESQALNWQEISSKAKIKLIYFQLQVKLKQAAFILFASELWHLSRYALKLFQSDTLFHLLPKKSSQIIFGTVNPHRYKPAVSKTKIRRSLNFSENQVILLMVGRAEYRKQFHAAIPIAEKLQKLLPHKAIQLHFALSVGPFNDPYYLHDLIERAGKSHLRRQIHFHFGLTGPELIPYFQAADAYLMLSRQLETFGMVTLEALACGTPVFGINACATPEIVRDPNHLFLVKPSRLKRLPQNILHYLKLSQPEKNKLHHLLQAKIKPYLQGELQCRI